jgi:hypothetical protein
MDLPEEVELRALARRIRAVTSGNRRFKVTAPQAVALLRHLSPAELAAFAESAYCNVVPRMGRTVFEFTKSGRLVG